MVLEWLYDKLCLLCEPTMKSIKSSSSDNMYDIKDNIIIDEVLWTSDTDYYYDPFSQLYYKINI